MQHRMFWIVIEKMFINQYFTKNKAVINGKKVEIYGLISHSRFTLLKNPSVTRCMIWCRLFNSFKNFKNHNSRSKNFILVMLSRIVTCSKNCHILICGPVKRKFVHLLSKFRRYICNSSGEKQI